VDRSYRSQQNGHPTSQAPQKWRNCEGKISPTNQKLLRSGGMARKWDSEKSLARAFGAIFHPSRASVRRSQNEAVRDKTVMKIGIIGAGNIGGTLARRFSALGHKVFVANSRGPETLTDLAAESGATPVTVERAAQGGDVVIVTIPLKNVSSLPAGLFAKNPKDVVVVDTGNYYPRQRDGRIKEIEDGLTESQWVEKQLGRPVVKAFNNIYAEHLYELGRPPGSPGRIALPVAGDGSAAKAVVLRLIDELGFDGVDAGGLDESWRQQPDTPVYATDLDANGVQRALAKASKERKPEWCATPSSPGTYEAPA
jgi:predicted dinucleotide-binding enzyme